MAYFRSLSSAFKTTIQGLSLTLRHLLGARKNRKAHSVEEGRYFDEPDGIFTMSFPEERMEVPVVGRYTLDCEIDDCIVCDKCARICPVDCIDIVPVKSAEVFDHASDGTPKRIYAAKFDIDMSKCCFCGLCTTVCPTECLTMTDDYDHTVADARNMVFPFATLSAEEARQKQLDYDKAQAAKVAAKAAAAPAASEAAAPAPDAKPAGARLQFRPVIRKPGPKAEEAPASSEAPVAGTPPQERTEQETKAADEAKPPVKPFRPYLRKPDSPSAGEPPAES